MKLLLATDGSPCSEAAVQEVYTRPWPPSSRVTVLAVSAIPFPKDGGETWDIGLVFKELAPRIAEQAALRLREHQPTLKVETRVINDLPKRAILDEAQRCEADLILVGSHGYRAVQRFLLGSVSQSVLLHAPCSVEVVRCRPRLPDNKAGMRILLAVDGSPCSDAAVREIRTRPWPAGSVVRVVTVAGFPPPAVGDPLLSPATIPVNILDEERKQAVALAEKAAAQIRRQAPSLPVEVEVFVGSPREEIIGEAERWEADLILLGSHGYGPVQRLLLGSVALSVALHAPCSVEIARCRPSVSPA